MAQVRCGNKVHRDLSGDYGIKEHHHESIAQVRLCFARGDDHIGNAVIKSLEEAEVNDYEDREAHQEYLAEQRAEEWWEHRGYMGPSEEEEARMYGYAY